MNRGRPAGTIEAGPRKEYRRSDNKSNTDPSHNSYRYSDSGCRSASRALGYQAVCLVNCPFDDCIIKTRDDARHSDIEFGYEVEPLYESHSGWTDLDV